MSLVFTQARARARTIPWLKIGIGIAIALYVLVSAKVLSGLTDPLVGAHLLIPVGIALFPLCVFLGFKYPLIFPFGLYVLITPVDALLSGSGAASLVKLIGLVAAGALLLRTLLLRRALVPRMSWLLWLVFVAYATLSMMWTPSIASGQINLTAMASLLLMMTVLAIYPARPLEFKVTIWLTVLSGVGAAIYSLNQFHSGSASVDNRLELHGLSAVNVQDPNYLGGAFLLSLALALTGVFYSKNVVVKILSGLSIPLMILGIFVTASRSAFIGASAIFVYFVIRSRYRIQALLAAAGCFALTAFYPEVLSRLFSRDVGSADGRTDIWATGMHSFGDHWLFGSGIASYQYNYDRNLLQVFQPEFAGWSRPGHSLIFVALNDYGVIGLLLVLLAWYVGFRQLRAIPKTSWLYGTRIGLEAAMIGLFIHMLFLDPFNIKYVWLAQSLPLLVLNLYAPHVFRIGRPAAAPVPRFRAAQTIRGS